jgi:glucose/arabinose dehydrogenase
VRRLALAAAVFVAGCGGGATSSGDPATASAAVRLQKIGDFSAPVFVTAPPKDKSRIFVVEQGGTIQVVKGSSRATFLDITNLVKSGGEQGLLSMAFAPDYASSGLFYVYYTDTNGDEQIVEYKRASEDKADPGSARQVLMTPDDEGNHNGGQLQFGPDKLLYIGTGDGGGGGDQHGAHGNGQNLGVLLGKILRIDPRASGGRPYSIPSGNPFRGKAGARPEIYAYGLRNPWRFSFDRANGAMTIGDVGQGEWEEINYRAKGKAKGANFGWRVFEGKARYGPKGESAPGAVKPLLVESHADGNCSITGGYVVRDPALKAWRGRYVFGDYCRGVIQTANTRTGKVTDRKLKVESLSSFGEDARGRVYAASLDGPVYRLTQK